MKRLISFFRKNDGFALPTVLIAFVFLGILALSITLIATNNTRQVIRQEDNLKAHYLARSGIEIGYGALMMLEGTEILFETFLDGGRNETETLEDTVSLQGGDVTVSISRNGDYITIHAVGELDNDGGSSQIYLDIDIDDPTLISWRG